MPIKLFVQKTSETTGMPDEYLFDEEVISVGRDGANLLTLPDPKRIISKRHAEIRDAAAGAQLVDLGSKNFTYLNGERLEPMRPRDLQSGDILQIGDFELRYEEAAPTPEIDDRTVFDVSFVNPFEEDVQKLVEAFNRICQRYDQEPAARREDALRDALGALIVEPEPAEAKQVIAAELGLQGAEFDPDATAPHAAYQDLAPPPSSTRPSPRPPSTPPSSTPPPSGTATARPALRTPAAPEGRKDQLVQALLRTAAKLAEMPAHFRYEFAGHTVMHAADEAFLYERDPEALAKHLLDPGLPADEAARRIGLLEEALDRVAAHQLALLEGYKASVKEGAVNLVDYLDPNKIIEEIGEENALYRRVSAMAKHEAAERLQKRSAELRESDWGVVEQRFYRPAFIRAYLARMMSDRS